MKTAKTLADIKADPRVKSVQVEYDTIYEPTGKLYIVFLANGWTNEHLECSRIQETTVSRLLWQLNGTVVKS
jgi:hypothetical protein